MGFNSGFKGLKQKGVNETGVKQDFGVQLHLDFSY